MPGDPKHLLGSLSRHLCLRPGTRGRGEAVGACRFTVDGGIA